MKKRMLTAVSIALMMMLSGTAGAMAQNHRNQGVGNSRGTTTTNTRPGGNSTNRPNNNASGNRPGGVGSSGNHNGNSNQNSAVRPGGSGNNSGDHNGNNNQNSAVRPGGSVNSNGNHNWNNNHNSGSRPGGNLNWNSSVPRPGVGATPSPSTSGYVRPGRITRWERPLPSPPVRENYNVGYGVPSISNILGLTFGSLLDYGLRSLVMAGYNVAGTWDNTIYLNNVSQFGLVWPQATIYYGVGGMTGARFQYSSYAPSTTNFNIAYNAVCAAYGMPLSTNMANGVTTYTWWGGSNSGYITLQYGPGPAQNGSYLYYTDLIYGR